MFLLAGLGNPGREYARNRHNAGYMAVDEIVHRHAFSAYRRKFSADVADGTIGGEKILALKPATYMNRSGQSVGEAMRFYKLTPQDVIVIHDEIDLASGLLRVKRGGGHAGHNGLRDIDAHIGRDYLRLRIGVGHPGEKDAVNAHVLGDFALADRAWLTPLLDSLAENLPILIGGDTGLFMSRMAETRAAANGAGAG